MRHVHAAHRVRVLHIHACASTDHVCVYLYVLIIYARRTAGTPFGPAERPRHVRTNRRQPGTATRVSASWPTTPLRPMTVPTNSRLPSRRRRRAVCIIVSRRNSGTHILGPHFRLFVCCDTYISYSEHAHNNTRTSIATHTYKNNTDEIVHTFCVGTYLQHYCYCSHTQKKKQLICCTIQHTSNYHLL